MDTEQFKRAYNETRNGANHFIRHTLARNFAYSDGVQECADAGLYWLLDILCTELPAEFKKNEDISSQCIVNLLAKDGKASITAEFNDDVVAWSRDIKFTDLPDGEWKFLAADDGGGPTPYRLILLTEY